MGRDKRKGLYAGYKRAGPTTRFMIICTIATIVLAVVLFLIQSRFSASKALQNKAKLDMEVKHKEIVDSQIRQIKMLSQVEKGIEDLLRVTTVVRSSSVSVCLDFHVSEKTPQDFNGLIYARRDICTVETKSGSKLDYVSPAGSTRMSRRQDTYQFLFKAELPAEMNKLRDSPEEFFDAREIAIPMAGFLQIMKKKMSPKGTCRLVRADIGYSVNDALVARQAQDLEVEASEGKADVLYFTFR